jgi:hypothetical protein
MARPLRLFFEDAFYHITARVNQREGILRTGSVKQLEDYPWSSYLDYLNFNLRKSNISNLDPSFVLHLLSANLFESIEKYREYIIQHQNMKDPIQQSYCNIALGSEQFI